MSSESSRRHSTELLDFFKKNLKATSTFIRGLPTNVISARKVVQNAAISVSKRLPMKVSDDYVIGAVDIFVSLAVLYVTTPAIARSVRRFPTASHIPSNLINNRSMLHGMVMAVRDGDTLRVRHAPFLFRMLNAYKLPSNTKLSQTTINIRLAAIDAPECASFGNQGQKYGPIAREWLREYTLGRKVAFRVHAIDQYKRALATVYRKPENLILRVLGLGKRNVGLELTRAGYATLYTGSGAVYGGERLKRMYMKIEKGAREKKMGMWSEKSVATPMQYKREVRAGITGMKKLSEKNTVKQKQDSRLNNETGKRGSLSPAVPVSVIRFFEDLHMFLKRFR